MLPFNDIVKILLPHMSETADRRALIESALHGCAVVNQINWSGNAQTFTTLMVRKLIDFGECEAGIPAIVAVLETLKGQVGATPKAEIDALIAQIGAEIPPPIDEIDVSTLPEVDNTDLYIFISYARPQQAIAEQVETALRAVGLRVFRDTSDIRGGADWDMTIEQALQEADRMVLLLSDASMPYRKEVHREWFYFDQERKPIYPLYVEACQLHSRLYAYNYIDARDDLQGALARLLGELGETYALPGETVGADRIIVTEAAEARSLPDAMTDLLDAIRDPKGSIALTTEQISAIIKQPPQDMTSYRLARIAEWSQPRYQLDNRFVNLTLLMDKGEDAQQRWAQAETKREYKDLRDVMADFTQHPAFVLLGAPGSGKSTLLRRAQLDHCVERLRDDDDDSPVSFFIQLNGYPQDAPAPRAWLGREWERKYPDLPALENLLNRGRMVLLLDALNEMPHKDTADYHQRVMRWRQFTQQAVQTGNRVVFSCRSLDYSASISSKELRVPQIQVQPMSKGQVQAFLQVYLPEQAERIWTQLQGTPQFEVFKVPFFLKLLTEQVEASDDIPTGRAGLFAGFVREALKREIAGGNALFLPDTLLKVRDHTRLTQDKWGTSYDLPDRGVLIPSLSRLAFEMQEQGLETEAATVRLDYDDACDLLDHERDEDILKAGVSLNVLDEDVTQLEILFFHQLLQEFFAARELASNPDPARVRVAWRVDEVSPTLDEVLETLADNDPLPELPQTGWEETTLLASAMTRKPDTFVRDLMEANLPLAARCAAAPDVGVSEALKDDIRQALMERTQHPEADIRARISAGLALGELGDPRFVRRTGEYGDYLEPPLVTIPAGTYPIGDDESQYDDEKPAHTVDLESYQIGQFAVTNGEYALFMAAGGYEDERWWDTDAAQAWRSGDSTSTGQRQFWTEYRDFLMDYDVSVVEENADQLPYNPEWTLKARTLSQDEFEAWLSVTFPDGKRLTEPEYWNDTRFNNPNQPVVGVSWFEARAYCRWLSAQTGKQYNLPSEVEYEAAARGIVGRAYAYGQTFDSTKGNTFKSHLRRTSPVGIYAQGATPEGVYDLSGNTWDWTRSVYDAEEFPYPYKADDGREATDHSGRRVLRGSSWNYNYHDARVPYRDFNGLDYRISYFGFRVCRSSSPPEA